MADQNLKIQLTAIDKTRQAFSSVRAGLGRVGSSIGNVRTALAALGAGVALKQFATQIDDLAKASSRLGLTVNELQSLQFAASQTGASAEELEKGLTRFSRAISEASSGIGTGLRSFEALGIKVTDAQNNLRPTSELLDEVSDRLAQIEAPADRVRIAFDLFGRSGVNMVNTLQNGSQEVEKLQDRFNALTLVLTDDQAKAVEEANDLFDALGRTFSSFGQQITATVLPPLANFAKLLTQKIVLGFAFAIDASRNFVNFFIDAFNKIGETITALPQIDRVVFGEELSTNLRMIANQFDYVDDATGNVKNSIDDLTGSTENLTKGFRENTFVVKSVGVTYDEIGNKITNLGERSKNAFEKYIASANDMKSATEKMAIDGLGRLEDSFAGMVTGTMSAKDAFRSMANSILSDLARIAARKALGSIMGGFGGGDLFGSLFGGFRANGGAVTAGKAYVVGERGAEMFVPSQNGTIIPNGSMGGAGVTVNQTINLSTGVAQTVRTEVMNMLPQIQNAAVSGVLDAKRRGGSFSSAFGV